MWKIPRIRIFIAPKSKSKVCEIKIQRIRGPLKLSDARIRIYIVRGMQLFRYFAIWQTRRFRQAWKMLPLQRWRHLYWWTIKRQLNLALFHVCLLRDCIQSRWKKSPIREGAKNSKKIPPDDFQSAFPSAITRQTVCAKRRCQNWRKKACRAQKWATTG